MSEKILFVDDEANVVQGYKRSLRKIFDVNIAVGGQEGLEQIDKNGPYAVVVSDYKMPEMNGVQFLTEVRKRTPDTTRIMLTGQAEMEAAIAAINEGNIFRFLNKPCETEELTKVLNTGIEQYRLITAERVLLQETLNGSAKVLVEVLSSVNPMAFSRASRIKSYVSQIIETLALDKPWTYELAAMLSQIGCVSLPEDIVQKAHCGEELNTEDQALYNNHPEVGKNLIVNIPRLDAVAGMIGGQMRDYAEYSSGKADEQDDVARGAQILKAATDFDQHIGIGRTQQETIDLMVKASGSYSPEILGTLGKIRLASSSELVTTTVSALTAQMTFAEDVYSEEKVLLVPKGQAVTYPLIERLKNFAKRVGVTEPLYVFVRK